ncbi:MAG: MBL fold metallo-hydrolase [Clostridia bacterium]|nr:MBL fold metallo-hydrolase [Clostridia bacterium]
MTDRISINAHSSIRIEGEKTVYFDPFKITEEAHDADIIFVTHAHFDHYSPEDIAKIQKSSTVLVVPESMKDQADAVYMNPGDVCEIDGIRVEAVPSYNTNKPMHPKSNGWLGYIVELGGRRIYVAGDMDAIPEAENFVCDIAMIPIGGTYTMNAAEAAELINKMKPKTVIPTHYGAIVGEAGDGRKFAEMIDTGIETVLKI